MTASAHGHDHHAHDHAHGHGHGHVHAPGSFGAAFAIGSALNIGFVVVEAGFGFASHSVALVADAGHNLSDVLGLLVAWGAAVLSQRRPRGRYTYGFRSTSILAALFNALFLVAAVGAIGVEAVRRLFEPGVVGGWTVMAVAAAGIAVNGATAWLFARGRKGDINIRAAFLHMASDAVISAGVVATGAVIVFTGWTWLDPLASLAIVVVILAGTWSLLRDSIAMGLQAAPAGADPQHVGAMLRAAPGVTDVHDLHVWPMSTTETALTAHLVIPAGHPDDAYTCALAEALKARFGIDHVTLQIETDPDTPCALQSDHVV